MPEAGTREALTPPVVLVDTAAAAAAVGVAPATIRKWVQRKKLQYQGKDGSGRNLVDLTAVYTAAQTV
jgi:transposase-like protein